MMDGDSGISRLNRGLSIGQAKMISCRVLQLEHQLQQLQESAASNGFIGYSTEYSIGKGKTRLH